MAHKKLMPGTPITDPQLREDAELLLSQIEKIKYPKPEHWVIGRKLMEMFQVPRERVSLWPFLIAVASENCGRSRRAETVMQKGLVVGQQVYYWCEEYQRDFKCTIRSIAPGYQVSVLIIDEDYPGKKSITCNPLNLDRESRLSEFALPPEDH